MAPHNLHLAFSVFFLGGGSSLDLSFIKLCSVSLKSHLVGCFSTPNPAFENCVVKRFCLQVKVNHSKYRKYVLSGAIISDPCTATVLTFWINPTPHDNWLCCYRTLFRGLLPSSPSSQLLSVLLILFFCDEWAWPAARRLVQNQISPW